MIYIIGAGLFGAVARDLLRDNDIPCQTVDDGRPLSGSYPAGCLIKPSWLTKIPRRDRERAMIALDHLYGMREFPIRVGPMKLESIRHVPPSTILQPPDITGTVTKVDPTAGRFWVSRFNRIVGTRGGVTKQQVGIEEFTGHLLIAAGVWCRELLPEHFADVPLTGLQGCSQRFAQRTPEAQMSVWAPFKQSVRFEIEDGITWFGDGTALKPESWTPDHTERSLKHAVGLGLRRANLMETRVGLRPYIKGQTGWFRQLSDRCWVSTGGAKNGVVLAAVQALEFMGHFI
jgi:hypothetical protein